METIPPVVAAHRDRVRNLGAAVSDIVLLLRDEGARVAANAFAELAPGARVHVLGASRELTDEDYAALDERVSFVCARSQQARIDYLARIPRPQVMIDAGNKKRAHKLSSLRQLLYFVQPGGFYSVEDLSVSGNPRWDDGAGENVLDLLARIAAARPFAGQEQPQVPVYVNELAAAISSITFEENRAVLERGGEALWFKLRDWESDDVLTTRYGTAWGQVVTDVPARTFRSRAEVTSHGEGPIPSGRKEYEVPQLFVRRYDEVLCTARQIVRYGEYVLPDSWRHPQQRVLNNRQLIHSSAFFGRYHARTEADRRAARTRGVLLLRHRTAGTLRAHHDRCRLPSLGLGDRPSGGPQRPAAPQRPRRAQTDPRLPAADLRGAGHPARTGPDHRAARGGRGRDPVRGQSAAGEPVLRRSGPAGGLAAG